MAGLTGTPSLLPDRNIFVPMASTSAITRVPLPGVMPGFGHVGPGRLASAGPIRPAGLSFGFVHNRLLTRMVLDQVTFAGLHALIRRDADRAAQARLSVGAVLRGAV